MSPKVSSSFGFRQHRSMLALIVATTATAVLLSELVMAGPVNPSVQRGDVTITQDGNNFIITASDGSIINYDAFGILHNESIRFVQPGDTARVLNRITGADPTLIEGGLFANGIVYIVNPAGVFFSQGSIVNVGGIYAAAGSITDEDYINNVDQFSNLSGMVQNDGTIRADLVHLIGKNVANHGQIVAPRGIVTMLAGNTVLIRQHGERITVRIDGTDLDDVALSQESLDNPFGISEGLPGVENTGLINVPRGEVFFGAGDLYSIAIRNTGIVHACKVTTAITGEGRHEGNYNYIINGNCEDDGDDDDDDDGDDDDDDDDEKRSDNLATALPDQLKPIKDVVQRDPFASRSLERLGIYLRSLRTNELLANVKGSETFDDAPRKANRTPQEHEIAANRLRRASVLAVLKRFDDLVLREVEDEETGEVKFVEQVEQIRTTLASAWSAYSDSTVEEEEPIGFLEYISANSRHDEALVYIEGLRMLAREMWIMGLTPREMRLSLTAILGPLLPESIEPEQFTDVLGLDFAG